ncbi:MAG: hypothetical protein EAX87_06315 [Candidatus Thorarchaeota archaeon]|nr:hypothetical protein [Candidatus Thorarchaeota archaeon]
MPYIVTHSRYPTHKIPEVSKRYLEVMKKFPPDETLSEEIVPASVKATELGIATIGISLVKEGKLDEALKRTTQSMLMYHDIEGYEFSIEVQNTVSEALAFLGMSTSE